MNHNPLRKQEAGQWYSQVCHYVMEGNLKSAMDALKEMIRDSGHQEFFYELDELKENYRALLKYSFEGYEDPRQQSILDGIKVSLLSMADSLRDHLSESHVGFMKLEKQALARFSVEPDGRIPGNADDLFRILWLTPSLGEALSSMVTKVLHSPTLPGPDKCLAVSGLTLGLLCRFDPGKFTLLYEFINHGEERVRQRALTGFILGLLKYDGRLRLYPEIVQRISHLAGDSSLTRDAEIVFFQLLMARETEKITRKFEEEVLPDMRKMMPRMEDKLQLDKLFETDDPEDKNPEWKDLIEEVPGLFEKIEKFTRMQMEGADVFMGAFSMLKRFDFFDKMSNWFVPFYSENPHLKAAFADEQEFGNRLLHQLEKAFYICDSDKYSFALNFRAIPLQQKSMIVTQFEAEMEQMHEMVSEEKILGKDISSQALLTQYIQDLYRFFKLFPYKSEFPDPFTDRLDFGSLWFFRTFFARKYFLEKAGRFYFENDHYREAADIYRFLTEREDPAGEYFERIAFSFQKIGEYRKAIGYYKKAELFDTNRLWVLKKLGFCHLRLNEPEEALRFFLEAARLQPDDLSLQAQVGHCCLLMNDYSEALQHYSKVQFYQPDNLKALRPIAFCHFVLGKLDEAAGFYREILSSGSASPFDYINAGHTELCLHRHEEALTMYLKSLNDKTFSPEMLLNAFREDAPHLVRNGVKKEDLVLITDYILFNAG